jgi:hypothetical protein
MSPCFHIGVFVYPVSLSIDVGIQHGLQLTEPIFQGLRVLFVLGHSVFHFFVGHG